MANQEPRKPYTNDPNATYEDNVAPHSRHYDLPVEERRELGKKFGPNWASVLAGIGDQ